MDPQSFVPMIVQGPTPYQNPRSIATGEVPPARIVVAAEVLMMLSSKTSARAAANAISIELIDGQKLTTAESNLQATACNAINDYLNGRFPPNYWERGVKERQAEPDTVGSADHPANIVNCFACMPGPPSPKCRFCEGGGTIFVQSVRRRDNS